MVTKENKIQFEKWYPETYKIDENYNLSLEDFYRLNPQLQIGVYLAYYDWLGIGIDVMTTREENSVYFEYCINEEGDRDLSNTRNEAYKEAFKKADEIVNNTLTNKGGL